MTCAKKQIIIQIWITRWEDICIFDMFVSLDLILDAFLVCFTYIANFLKQKIELIKEFHLVRVGF